MPRQRSSPSSGALSKVTLHDTQNTLAGVDAKLLHKELEKALSTPSEKVRAMSTENQKSYMEKLCQALNMFENLADYAETNTRQILAKVMEHKLWIYRQQSEIDFFALEEHRPLLMAKNKLDSHASERKRFFQHIHDSWGAEGIRLASKGYTHNLDILEKSEAEYKNVALNSKILRYLSSLAKILGLPDAK